MPSHSRSLVVALMAVAAPLLVAACSGSTTADGAALDGLSLSAGSLHPAFDSAVTEYSAVLPNGTLGVTVTPTASAAHAASITVAQDAGAPAAVASGAASAPLTVPARGVRSVVTIAVAAPAGGAARTYTVALVQADNADATLASLGLSAGTLSPGFSSDSTGYAVTLPNGTTSLKVTPTASYPNVQSVSVAQDAGAAVQVASGSQSQALTAPSPGGQTTITVKVTAQNGYTTQAYAITVVQAGNGDASLASLKPGAGALEPAFASGTTSYALVVPRGTATVTLTPKANNTTVRSILLSQDGGASVAVANGSASAALPVPAAGAQSNLALTVTAQDGTDVVTYAIALSQQSSSDAALSALALSAGALSPAFSPATLAYAAAVPYGTASVTVTPTAHDASVRSITVAQDGGPAVAVASGSASAALPVPAPGTATVFAVVVTAQDGTTAHSYTVTATQLSGADASLSALALSAGALTPVFSSAATSYSAVIPHGTATVTVTPTATSALVRSIGVSLNGGVSATVESGQPSAALAVPAVGATSVLAVAVLSQDGLHTQTYSVSISQAASTDSSLASLALSGGSLRPAFSGATTTYDATVPSGTAALTVIATANDADARSITLAQDAGAAVPIASGATSAALAVPPAGTPTVLRLVVTAQSGATTSYQMTVTRAATNDAALSALSVSAGALTPAFASGTLAYAVVAPYTAATVTVTPTASSPDVLSITVAQDAGAPVAVTSGTASLALTLPASGTSNIAIQVTAQDGATTLTYAIALTRHAPDTDAALSALSASAGILTPSFASGVLTYGLKVPFLTSSTTLTPTAQASDIQSITLAQDGGVATLLASGAQSAALTVPAYPGTSTVSIVVTAQDGATKITYSLTLSRQAPDTDAALSALTTSVGTLSPVFSAGVTSYAFAVPFGTSTVTVTPVAHASDATIAISRDSGTPVPVASGSPSAPLPVPSFGTSSTISVIVTAQDGTTTQTWVLTLAQANRNDATLSALTDSAGALTGFSPSTLTYSYSIPFQTGSYSVTATTNDALAMLTVNGALATSGQPVAVALSLGVTSVTIVVTSADGTATGNYALTITESTPGPGLVHPRTVPVTQGALRTVAVGAYLPGNLDTSVPVDTLLRLGFDSAPTLGTSGYIRIFTAAGVQVDAINLADTYAVYNQSTKLLSGVTTKVNVIGGIASGIGQVRVVNYVPILISGNTAVIVPHNNKLAYNTSYYVTVDNGVLSGKVNGNAFGGVTSAGYWAFTTRAAAPATLRVADDNSADFATVQGAIDSLPTTGGAPATINIAPGVYQELLFVRGKNNVTLQGTNDGLGTIIQYDNCDGFNPGTGSGSTVTGGTIAATPSAGGRSVLLFSSTTGVVLDSVTLMNLHAQGSTVVPTIPVPTTVVSGSAGPTFLANYTGSITQAETFYFNSQFSVTAGVGSAGTLIAKHSNFISYQDTIQVKGFSWFYDCFITGDTDFIWGNANIALFEHSEVKSRGSSGASVVQSRAYLGWGSTATPGNYNTSYPGFVFLNSALTKDDLTTTAYLARSPGVVSTSGSSPAILYAGYDIVSFIGCSMDTHIVAGGWGVTGGNPAGANVVPSPITGWREYKSVTPAGTPLDVSSRAAGSTAPYGSIQLSDANVATFFKDRTTIFGGTNDGTFTTLGLTGFAPVP